MGISAALAFGALAGAAAGGAFNKPKPPAEAEKPPVMPTQNDTLVQGARRRSIAQQMASRRGRQSTILTGQDEKLGG